MQITKKQLKPSEVELTIEIDIIEIKPFLEKAAIRLSNDVKIEGFRPGKAPFDIVKQKVGEMALYQEALDNTVSHFFVKAMEQEKINSVGQPKIDLEKMAPGNPIVFKATVGLMPEIKLGDYKKVKVQKKEVKLEDKEIDKVINDIRKMQVKEVLVDRVIKQGDRAEVDFEVSLDKVVIDGGQGKKYPVVIGDKQMIPGFEEELIGMKKDEEKKFQLKFPEKYQNKMVAGKMCDFKAKVLSVFERELPELTDEMAKTVGGENVADLKSKIKKNLEEEKKFHEDQRVEIEMLNKIVEQTEFSELPEVLIHSESHRMIHEFEDSISRQGIKFDDYLKSIKKEKKDLAEEFKPKAIERVKTSLAIKEIADKENIQAEDKEIQLEVERIMEQVKDNPEARENVKSEGYKQYIKTIIRNRKVVEMLRKECIS